MGGAPTIRKRLLLRLIGVVALVWCVLLLFVYWAAESEVEEVFDAALAQEARVLATLLIHEADEETERRDILQRLVTELGEKALWRSPLLTQLVIEYGQQTDSKNQEDYLTLLSSESNPGHKYESTIAFMVSYGDEKPMLRSPNAPSFHLEDDGFYNLGSGEKGWRVFGFNILESSMRVHVGERMAVRQETVASILINSLWPMFLSLPILGLIIWVIVGKGLLPLNRLANTVERRDPGSLQPIVTGDVPGEVVPIVYALNGLFRRVRRALENERRFTANAAHELRTPLAALKTQAQVKQLDDNSEENAGFLNDIVTGVDRTTHLLEQLLTLARADTLQQDSILQQKIDLHGVTTEVLSLINQNAQEKGIELSLDSADAPVYIRGDATTMNILVRNLVDNGIRYTPAGGEVRLHLLKDGSVVRLLVEDNGPGIPEEQREDLFRRFQRGEGVEASGSGLGLSIVKQIADLHCAGIMLSDASDGQGLCVTVTFPV